MRQRYLGGTSRPRIMAPRPTTIDLAGDWRACTDVVPKGCAVFGTVNHDGETGALVQLDNGNFLMVRDGKTVLLDARTIRRLIEDAENPPERPAMIPVEQWEREQE